MILTFSLLGEYLDMKIDEWMGNVWGGNLILAGFAIALALVVAFFLLKSESDSSQEVMSVEFGKKEVILAFFSQLALVQIYFKPFEVTQFNDGWGWVLIWSFYFAAFYGATSYFIPVLLKDFAP